MVIYKEASEQGASYPVKIDFSICVVITSLNIMRGGGGGKPPVPVCGFTAVLLYIDGDFDSYSRTTENFPFMLDGLLRQNWSKRRTQACSFKLA